MGEVGRLHQSWAPRGQPGRPPPPGSPRQGAARRGRRPSPEFPPLGWGSDPSLPHLGHVHPSALREGDVRSRAYTEAVCPSSPENLAARLPGQSSPSGGETNRKGEQPATQRWAGENQAAPGYWCAIHSGKLTFQCQVPGYQVAGTRGGSLSSSANCARGSNTLSRRVPRPAPPSPASYRPVPAPSAQRLAPSAQRSAETGCLSS